MVSNPSTVGQQDLTMLGHPIGIRLDAYVCMERQNWPTMTRGGTGIFSFFALDILYGD